MKLLIVIAAGLTFAQGATATTMQKRIELENQLRDRVTHVVNRIDPMAIVQVTVDLKTISGDLPEVGLVGAVTPVDFDGDLGLSSIAKVNVLVVHQVEQVPEWIKKEIERAVRMPPVKTDIAFEKAGGVAASTSEEVSKVAQSMLETANKGLRDVRFGLFGLMGVAFISLIIIAFAVFSSSGRLEKSLARVIEEKVVPAMSDIGGGRGSAARAEAAPAQANAPVVTETGGHERALVDYPDEALLTLFADCYWTGSDGYAHYLWTQIKPAQREMLMNKRVVDVRYFWHIVNAEPEKLAYHDDARYLISGAEFRGIDQQTLLDWAKNNPDQTSRITPLRWESLALSLPERLDMLESRAKPARLEALPKFADASSARELPPQLSLKTITVADEEFLWANPQKLPVSARASFRSLLWLALCEEAYVRDVLSDMDARGLAMAWVGPQPVLDLLKSKLPAKKREMLEHFLQNETPSRASESFDALVGAGLAGLPTETPEKREAA